MVSAPAMAGSGCHKAAKAAYPHDRKARHAYKKGVQGALQGLEENPQAPPPSVRQVVLQR
jgi:hypothetical protein